MLLDRQLGLLTGVMASGFVTLLATNEVPATLYALISCSAAAYGIRQYRERQSVTLAGLVVSGVNCLMALALSLFPRSLTITGGLVTAGTAIGGGLLTIIFPSGGGPVNQSVVRNLTGIRL